MFQQYLGMEMPTTGAAAANSTIHQQVNIVLKFLLLNN
jgi:hypothetical protein